MICIHCNNDFEYAEWLLHCVPCGNRAKSNFAHQLSELLEEYDKTPDMAKSTAKGKDYFAGFSRWLKEYK